MMSILLGCLHRLGMRLLFSNSATDLARLDLEFSGNFLLKLILPELDVLLVKGRFMRIFIMGKKF